MASHSSPSSGPLTVSGIQLALQLGWPHASALTAHLARVSSLSGPAPAGIRPVITGPPRRGDGLLPACSRCLSAAGIRYCGHPAPARNSAPLAIGGFGANHHLRQSLVFLNVPAMQQPEAYIGGAANLFDAEGKMTNESTHDFLGKFVQSFSAWIETNRKR